MLRLLGATAERRGATLIFSSHQPDLATRFADRVVALKDGRNATAILAKFYAEAVEEVDSAPVAALESAGATTLQRLRHGVWPQMAPDPGHPRRGRRRLLHPARSGTRRRQR